MMRALSILLMILTMTEASFAQVADTPLLEQRVGRAIRKAGFWCGWVSYLRIDTTRSVEGAVILLVTCDDRTRYQQYNVSLDKDNKIEKIEERK